MILRKSGHAQRAGLDDQLAQDGYVTEILQGIDSYEEYLLQELQ